jgi:hypothetical protein
MRRDLKLANIMAVKSGEGGEDGVCCGRISRRGDGDAEGRESLARRSTSRPSRCRAKDTGSRCDIFFFGLSATLAADRQADARGHLGSVPDCVAR